jgi:hypothetical protein
LALLKKMLTATLGHGKTKVRSPRGAVGSSRHKIGTRSAPR